MAQKKWVFNNFNKLLANELAAECDIDPMVALLLSGRGFEDAADIDSFICQDQQLSDPFELPDMQLAVERIERAIQAKEIIAVCGDYDADGVTASALLYSYLAQRGCPVICDIPERLEEGYGLHRSTIDRLKGENVSLIITVDNGIGCIDEIDYAVNLDIDVVVTDHHRPGHQLPNACAIVDPYLDQSGYGFLHYSGVGVAFKLICALENCPCEELMPEYGDLVAIGTVADVVPLVDENRLLVKQGIQALNNTERVGLLELIAASDLPGEQLSADQISYAIAPRINAAGRMGKSRRAFELLITQDVDEARELAGEICFENMRRHDVEATVSSTCRIQHLQSGRYFYDRVIVIAGHGWHPGVLGIVAARICSQFGKPTIVLSVEDETAKGSARSIDGFDLFEALSACSDCLLQFGGHTLAAGLTIDYDKIDEFRIKINEYARASGPRPVPQLNIDCKLTPLGAGEQTAQAIRCLAPHGCQNPAPVFALMNMQLDSIQPVGGGKSARMILSRNGSSVVCMKFGTSPCELPFQVGDVIDLAVVYRYSTYRNKPAFSLVVQDYRPSGFNDSAMFDDLIKFEGFMAGEEIALEERIKLVPSREQMGTIYRFIRFHKKLEITPDVFLFRLGYLVSAGQLLVSLKVFEEFDFVEYYFDGEKLCITYHETQGKFDLSNSDILLKLQS